MKRLLLVFLAALMFTAAYTPAAMASPASPIMIQPTTNVDPETLSDIWRGLNDLMTELGEMIQDGKLVVSPRAAGAGVEAAGNALDFVIPILDQAAAEGFDVAYLMTKAGNVGVLMMELQLAAQAAEFDAEYHLEAYYQNVQIATEKLSAVALAIGTGGASEQELWQGFQEGSGALAAAYDHLTVLENEYGWVFEETSIDATALNEASWLANYIAQVLGFYL